MKEKNPPESSQGDEHDFLLGEYSQRTLGEIVVTTDRELSTHENVVHELRRGKPHEVSLAQRKRGKVVGAIVRGSRKMGMIVGDHKEEIGVAVAVVAGTLLLGGVVVSRARNRQDTTVETPANAQRHYKSKSSD